MRVRGTWGIASAIALALTVQPAQAQWTRAAGVPADVVYALHAKGDTVLAGNDTLVFVSTDRGASWRRSAPFSNTLISTDALYLRNGRIWAGTVAEGVFSSDDLGNTWQDRSAGLAGGLFNSDHYVLSFAERRDSLYVGTGGAGVFVRAAAGNGVWVPTGGELVANQSGGVEQMASDSRALIAVGGSNGIIHRNTGGAPWQVVSLVGGGIVPDLSPTSVVYSGTRFLIGTNHGVFSTLDGQAPVNNAGLALTRTIDTRLATDGRVTVACVNRSSGAFFYWTTNEGLTWTALESLPVVVLELAIAGDRLWAARTDGLWYRDLSTVSVPDGRRPGRRVALLSPNPVVEPQVRFAVQLERDARVELELFDVTGRRVHAAEHILAAGRHELALPVQPLASGVYHLRLTGHGQSDALRFVRVRS